MRQLWIKAAAIATAIIAGLCIASYGQTKKLPAAKKPVERWIKVYNNLMMGVQTNSSIGQFLKTATGEVIAVQDAERFQKEIAFVFFTEYGANYATLTFPGNAAAAASYGTDEISVFTESPGGMNHWEQGNLNSGYITWASTSDGDMSASDFNEVAESKSWANFSKMFSRFNSGSGKLSYVGNYVHLATNNVYMFQLNNTIRGFIYEKNLTPKSAKGGSFKFDLIIEGSDEHKSSDVKGLQPSKD